MPELNPPTTSGAMIGRALGIFHPPGHGLGFELRAFRSGEKARIQRFPGTPSGQENAVDWAVAQDNDGASGVYVVANPIRLDLRRAARDEDVVIRRWLLIDFDPVREADTSSTDAEKDDAWKTLLQADSILGTLQGRVVADSGNGYHLCFPIDLANDDASRSRVKLFLESVAAKCSSATVKVDTINFNASRIWKLYGTRARKGTLSTERPHRRSGLIEGTPWCPEVANGNNATLERLLQSWQAAASFQRAAILSRAQDYVRAMQPAIAGQGGHKQTYEAAMYLVKGFALTEDEAWPILLEFNRRCQPEWAEKDLRRKLTEAMKARTDTGFLLDWSPPAQPSTSTASSVPPAGPDEWPEPVDLDGDIVPESFPLDVFPAPVQDFAQQAAWAMNAPADYIAAPMLAVASAAIGNSLRLAITRSFRAPSILFIAIVGRPGTTKSPALAAAKKPLTKAQQRMRADHRRARRMWVEGGREGDEPSIRRCLVERTTTEALIQILDRNPRGVLWARDELSGLIGGLDAYRDGGKGDDRQTLLQLWSAEPVLVDRVRLEGQPICVNRPCVSITGTLQPATLSRLRQHNGRDLDDGFFDRFLFSWPPPLPSIGEEFRAISEQAESDWDRTICGLADIPLGTDRDGEADPRSITLDASGVRAWESLTWSHAAEENDPERPMGLDGPWSKLRGYAGRLTLVLHAMHSAVASWPMAPEVGQIPGTTVDSAGRLLAYFKSHCRAAWGGLGRDPRVAEAKSIMRWLRQVRPGSTFRRSDLWRGIRHRGEFRQPEDLGRPLELLGELQWIRPMQEPKRDSTGRRPGDLYQLNPRVRFPAS